MLASRNLPDFPPPAWFRILFACHDLARRRSCPAMRPSDISKFAGAWRAIGHLRYSQPVGAVGRAAEPSTDPGHCRTCSRVTHRIWNGFERIAHVARGIGDQSDPLSDFFRGRLDGFQRSRARSVKKTLKKSVLSDLFDQTCQGDRPCLQVELKRAVSTRLAIEPHEPWLSLLSFENRSAIRFQPNNAIFLGTSMAASYRWNTRTSLHRNSQADREDRQTGASEAGQRRTLLLDRVK